MEQLKKIMLNQLHTLERISYDLSIDLDLYYAIDIQKTKIHLQGSATKRNIEQSEKIIGKKLKKYERNNYLIGKIHQDINISKETYFHKTSEIEICLTPLRENEIYDDNIKKEVNDNSDIIHYENMLLLKEKVSKSLFYCLIKYFDFYKIKIIKKSDYNKISIKQLKGIRNFGSKRLIEFEKFISENKIKCKP